MIDPAATPLNPTTFDDIVKLISSGGSVATIIITWAALRAKSTVDEIIAMFKTSIASLVDSMRAVVAEIREMRRDIESLKLMQTQTQNRRAIVPRLSNVARIIVPDSTLPPGDSHE